MKFPDVLCIYVSACVPGSSTSHPQSISVIQKGCFAAALWATVWFQSFPCKMKARRTPVLKDVNRYSVTVKSSFKWVLVHLTIKNQLTVQLKTRLLLFCQ